MTSFARPSLQTLKHRIMADIDTQLPGAISRPQKSVLSVLAIVLAGVFHTLYGFGAWILQQIDPLTATEEWLLIWGSRLGVPRKPALSATGTCLFAGDSNIEIPAGTEIVNPVSKGVYKTLSSGAAGTFIDIEAIEPGLAGNRPLSEAEGRGNVFTLLTPVEGIELDVSITAITGGADQESLSSWATRIATRLKERQQIGDKDDYHEWALQSHTDIIDARVSPNTPAAGEITIRVVVQGDNPFPSAAVLADAQQQIDTIRNAGATVYLAPMSQQAVAVRIAGISDTATQTAIENDIKTMLSQKRERGSSLYPEEIERVIKAHQEGYASLLAPISKLELQDDSLFALASMEWLS